MSRVGGRGYPPPDAYDDRPRRRNGRDYQDVEVDVRDTEYRRPPPDYLREDYGRPSNAGPMVVRERSEVDFDRRERDNGSGRSRPPPGGRGGREEIDIDIREQERSHGPPRPRRRGPEDENIDVEIRETSRQPPPPSRGQDREISFRRGEGERRPPRNSEREEIIIRRQDDDPSPPPRRLERSRSRIDVDIREEDSGPPPRPRSRAPSRAPERENIDIRIREDNERAGRSDRLTVREEPNERRRSMPPPRAVAREREEFVYRRPRSPSPQPRQSEEIIIRQRKSPSPSPSPPPAPSPPVETRPPIVQEIITHHRTIDHGVVRAARSPSSSPSPPPRPKKRDDLEIDIRRKDGRGNEEDIRINETSGRESRREREDERRITRRRSMESAPQSRGSTKEETNINVNIDANLSGNTDRRMALATPQRAKPKELWTEVTKDLVSREAIVTMGYQFEETEDYFYVMEALRYPEVAQLVEVTEELHYGRKERIEQIQWERQDPRFARDSRPLPYRGPPPGGRSNNGWDEITYERDVTYEDRPRRGGYR